MSRPSGMRDLTEGPVARTLLAFSVPTLGSNILQSLNASIGAIYVGKLIGEQALAATSVALMVAMLMFSTVFGLTMATTILVGQAMGRRDIAEVRRTVGAAGGMFAIIGVVIGLLGFATSEGQLRLMATPADAMPFALDYLQMVYLGMPFVFLSMLLQSSLRGVGDAVSPMWATVINVVICVVLAPALILGWGPFPALGITGAALSGIVANIVSLGYLLHRIYAEDRPIRLRGEELRLLRPDWAHLKPIMAIGLPMGVSMIIMSVSGLLMMGLINREGVTTVAAYGAINQLWNYIQMPAMAIGSGVSAMAAQNIGAQRWDRISAIARAGLLINVGMTLVLWLLTLAAELPLLGLFLPADSPAIGIGAHINLMVGWTFILMGVSMIVTSIIRANGAVLAPLLILIVSTIFVRLGIGFGFYDQYGADAIWAAFMASSSSAALAAFAYYQWGNWRARRIGGGAPEAQAAAVLPEV